VAHLTYHIVGETLQLYRDIEQPKNIVSYHTFEAHKVAQFVSALISMKKFAPGIFV